MGLRQVVPLVLALWAAGGTHAQDATPFQTRELVVLLNWGRLPGIPESPSLQPEG